MRLSTRLALALTTLAWPTLALAAPSFVSNIRASFESDQVHVSWNAPTDGDPIALYRIYYSRASILNNNGEYEEFATVSGKQTDYILTDFPRARSLFVSVLAVNDKQEESPFFVEEAKIDIPETSGASTAGTIPATESLKLLRAESLSSTGIVLVFSATPYVDPVQAPSAFQVTDGSGNVLALTRFEVRDTRVFLTTVPQEENKTYTVRVAPVVQGKSPFGDTVALDPNASSAFFLGSTALPALPLPIVANGPARAGLPEVRQLHVQPIRDDQGTYTVVVSWQPPIDAASITGYRIGGARGAGSAQATQVVPAHHRSVRLERIAPGPLTVTLQTVNADGSLSTGVSTSTTLDAGPTKQSPLTHSGPGAAAVLAMSGAVYGWMRGRRRSTL